MILSMPQQTLLFLLTVGAGLAMGFLFDIFRIFRKTVPHTNIVTQLEDLLYWLLVSLLMFYFMLHKNYGEIRLFSILGASLGAVLYFYTISAIIIKVSVTVIEFAKRVVRTAIGILLIPVKLLIRLLSPPARFVYIRVRKRLHSAGLYVRMKTKKTVKSLSIMRKKV